MARVELVDMEFFAHHGCFEEEQIIGNKFRVNFWATYTSRKAEKSDDIDDALNYQLIYNEINQQMQVKSHLLENVAYRILKALNKKFPQIVEAQITIDKLNPPLGGQVGASRVVLDMQSVIEENE